MKKFMTALALFSLFAFLIPVSVEAQNMTLRERILAMRARAKVTRQDADTETRTFYSRPSYRRTTSPTQTTTTSRSMSLRDRLRALLGNRKSANATTSIQTKDDNSSVISRQTTSDYKPDGFQEELYESGNKAATGRFNEEGMKIGTWNYWYDDTQTRERTEQYNNNGKPIGQWFEWYPNGRKKSKMIYNVQHQKDGTWEEWYEDGGLKFIGTYRRDLRKDDWYWYYDRNKREHKKIEYNRYGNVDRETHWNENGKLAFQVNLEYGPGQVVRGGNMAIYNENGLLNRAVILEEGMDLEALREELLGEE